MLNIIGFIAKRRKERKGEKRRQRGREGRRKKGKKKKIRNFKLNGKILLTFISALLLLIYKEF